MTHIMRIDENFADETKKQNIISSFRKLRESITKYFVSKLENTSEENPLDVNIDLNINEYETRTIISMYSDGTTVYFKYDNAYDYSNLDDLDMYDQIYIMEELD